VTLSLVSVLRAGGVQTTPTHISAILQFRSGVIGTLVASYDIWDHHLPWLEVYGTRARCPCRIPTRTTVTSCSSGTPTTNGGCCRR
jgi:hypothetical protein